MKKLCAILMVLTLTVSLLTGCDNVPDFFSDENGEEKATEVVTGFCDAIYALELKTAAGYTADPKATMELFPFNSSRDLDENLPEILSQVLPDEFKSYADAITPLVEPAIAYVQEKSSYELLSVEKDGNSYLATVEVTLPSVEGLDVGTLLQNKTIQSITLNLALSGQINLSMSQDQIIVAMLPHLANDLPQILNELNLPTQTKTITFTVVKVNSSWRIDLEKTTIADGESS